MDEEHAEDGLGPLPQSDRADEIETLGTNALRAVLPADRFRLRDERTDDKGVDASLELLIDGCYTNLRSQIQIKSSDVAEVREDGSVSVSVRRSNLNYLLSGPSPIYVLYIVPRDELRFIWARDEERRLANDKPDWKDQKTITLRFVEILSAERLTDIHDRIRREGQAHRRFAETLSNASVGSEVVVAVKPASLEMTNANEVEEFINSSGMAVVASGYAHKLLERVGLLSAQARQKPRICLVCAYAEFVLGRYYAAFSQLGLVGCEESELSEEDRSFYRVIRNTCELQLNRISREEYEQREQALADDTPNLQRQRRIAELKAQLINGTSVEEQTGVLKSLRAVVDEIISTPEGNEPFKLAAQIELVESEGIALIDEFSFAITVKGMRDDFGLGFNTAQTVDRAARALQRMHDWVETGNAIIEAAQELSHPLLLGRALFVSARVRFGLLTQRRILAGSFDVPASTLGPLVEHIDVAIDIFRQSGAWERELQARTLRAEVHGFLGETKKAQGILADVLTKARAMDFGQIVAHAESELTGQHSWSEADSRHLRHGASEDPSNSDSKLASQADEQVASFARLVWTANELGPGELPIVENHFRCIRDAAKERVSWCQHLVVVGEDPTLQEDPSRYCRCMKHEYESTIHYTDWTVVIEAFKSAHCNDCPDREPHPPPSKRPGTTVAKKTGKETASKKTAKKKAVTKKKRVSKTSANRKKAAKKEAAAKKKTAKTKIAKTKIAKKKSAKKTSKTTAKKKTSRRNAAKTTRTRSKRPN